MGEECVFPIDLEAYGQAGLELDAEEKEDEQAAGGSLLSRPKLVMGSEFLTIRISKWGIKDWDKYIDPFITVSVYGKEPCVAMYSILS